MILVWAASLMTGSDTPSKSPLRLSILDGRREADRLPRSPAGCSPPGPARGDSADRPGPARREVTALALPRVSAPRGAAFRAASGAWRSTRAGSPQIRFPRVRSTERCRCDFGLARPTGSQEFGSARSQEIVDGLPRQHLLRSLEKFQRLHPGRPNLCDKLGEAVQLCQGLLQCPGRRPGQGHTSCVAHDVSRYGTKHSTLWEMLSYGY